jgi:macrolide transport system ATP-binding/permease protein
MSWWRRLFASRRMERDLDSELRFHMEQQVADNVRAGMTKHEAQRVARLEFGGLQQIKEDCRESRGTLWVSSVVQDLRFALRQLRKSPGFAMTAVLTLALGIGANTSIFTLVHSILLRSLPVADPSHLYRIGDRNDCCYYDGFQNEDGDFDLFSYDLYLQFRQSATEFEQLAAVEAGGIDFSVRSGSVPAKPLRAEYVSGNYFTMLGVGAYAGRPLGDDDDKPGAAPAVVLSYQAWQTDFAADPGIVGSTIYVETHPFTVAGVAPPGFFGDRVVAFPPDLWMPLASEPLMEGANSSLLQKDEDWLYALGRVRPGINRRGCRRDGCVYRVAHDPDTCVSTVPEHARPCQSFHAGVGIRVGGLAAYGCVVRCGSGMGVVSSATGGSPAGNHLVHARPFFFGPAGFDRLSSRHVGCAAGGSPAHGQVALQA